MVTEDQDWNDVQIPGIKKTKFTEAVQKDIQKPKVEPQTTSKSITRHS